MLISLALTLAAAPTYQQAEQPTPGQADSQALGALREALQNPEASARIAALEQAAALTQKHPKKPTVAVAAVLVDALQDESFQVRREALRLLLQGQDPSTMAAGLVAASAGVRQEIGECYRMLKLMTSPPEEALVGGMLVIEMDDPLQIPAQLGFQTQLIDALGRVPEPAVERALVAWLRVPVAELNHAEIQGLALSGLRLGTESSVGQAIELLQGLHQTLADGVAPRFERLLEGSLTGRWLEHSQELNRGTLKELGPKLVELCGQQGWRRLPAWDASREAWAAWMADHRESFSKSPKALKGPLVVESVSEPEPIDETVITLRR